MFSAYKPKAFPSSPATIGEFVSMETWDGIAMLYKHVIVITKRI